MQTHHVLGVICVLLASHLTCLWAGKKWGDKLTEEAKAELNYLRARLAEKIAGPSKTLASNPYKKTG